MYCAIKLQILMTSWIFTLLYEKIVYIFSLKLYRLTLTIKILKYIILWVVEGSCWAQKPAACAQTESLVENIHNGQKYLLYIKNEIKLSAIISIHSTVRTRNINSIMQECNLRHTVCMCVKLSDGGRGVTANWQYTVRLPHTISSLLGSDGYSHLLINQVTKLHGCNATFAINTPVVPPFAIASVIGHMLLWIIANLMLNICCRFHIIRI